MSEYATVKELEKSMKKIGPFPTLEIEDTEELVGVRYIKKIPVTESGILIINVERFLSKGFFFYRILISDIVKVKESSNDVLEDIKISLCKEKEKLVMYYI